MVVIYGPCALTYSVPSQDDRDGYLVFLSWFSNTFRDLKPNAPKEAIVCHTRGVRYANAWGLLMADKSSAKVHMRWLPLAS